MRLLRGRLLHFALPVIAVSSICGGNFCAEAISTNTLLAHQGAALETIRAAESQGKDVSKMIETYNGALALLEHGSPDYNGSCNSYAACSEVAKADQILQSIPAEQLNGGLLPLDNSISTAESVIVCGVLAFLGGVGIIAFYKWWKNALTNGLLRSQLRRKSDE